MLRDYTYLALGSILCYPFLVADLKSIRKMQLKKGEVCHFDVLQHTIVFCASGSGEGHFVNQRKMIDRTFAVGKNKLFYWEPVGKVDLTGDTSNLYLLLIEFSLFSRKLEHAMPPDSLPDDFFHSPKSLPLQPISMNLPFVTKNEHSGLMIHYFNEILHRIEDEPEALRAFAEPLLPSIVVHWLRISQKEIHTLLNRVDSIKFSDDMANYEQIKAGQEIFISDIDIWDSDPREATSRRLFSFRARNVMDTFREWAGEPLRTEENGALLRICSHVESAYSIVLYPSGDVSSINLKPFQNTCYIRFRFLSNMPINFGIALYNRNTYCGLGHICHYTTPGKWKEEVFPILSDYQRFNNQMYIKGALNYIGDHYAHSVKRQDIARFLHISPGYLSNLFYQSLGISVTHYILQIRLSKSLELLKNTSLPMEDIAEQTGFYDVNHFSRMFQKEYGVRPVTYRKKTT